MQKQFLTDKQLVEYQRTQLEVNARVMKHVSQELKTLSASASKDQMFLLRLSQLLGEAS